MLTAEYRFRVTPLPEGKKHGCCTCFAEAELKFWVLTLIEEMVFYHCRDCAWLYGQAIDDGVEDLDARKKES